MVAKGFEAMAQCIANICCNLYKWMCHQEHLTVGRAGAH